jgi:PAS domain S-box-containing protein
MSEPPSTKETSAPLTTGKALAETLFVSHLRDAVPDALIAAERDGTTMQSNSQAMEMFGCRREQLLGQKIEVLVPERYRRQHSGHRDSFAQTPKVRRMGAGLDLFGRRQRAGRSFTERLETTAFLRPSGDLQNRKRM